MGLKDMSETNTESILDKLPPLGSTPSSSPPSLCSSPPSPKRMKDDDPQNGKTKEVTAAMTDYSKLLEQLKLIEGGVSPVKDPPLRYGQMAVQEVDSDMEQEPPKPRPYRWIMKRNVTPFYPSLCWESDDIQEGSVYVVADTLFKSHLYNIRAALACMTESQRPKKFIIWIDYDYFLLKEHPWTRKKRVDKMVDGKKSERTFSYWTIGDYSIAISPAMLGFRFTDHSFLIRHGIKLKEDSLPFVPYKRVRYLELDTEWTQNLSHHWVSWEEEYLKAPERIPRQRTSDD